MQEIKELTKLFFEAGLLKRVKRSGWWMAGVKDPESVAEHVYRAALIAYFLAKMEKADAGKAAMMTLLHDLPETRVNDLHKVGQRYIDSSEAEKKVFSEQVSKLPVEMAHEMAEFYNSYVKEDSKEGIVARDADLLECILTAKEYHEAGYTETEDWMANASRLLRTESAKALAEEARKSSSTGWWKGLKKINR